MKRFIKYILSILLIIPSFGFATSNIENDSNLAIIVLKSVMYVVIFIVVVLLAIYGTKFIAKRSQSLLKSKYIQIIDSVNVGQNTKIIIAKVSNFIYIISLNNNQTTLIDKIDINIFFENAKQDNFDEYLNKFIKNNKYEKKFSLNFKKKSKEFLNRIKFIKTGKEDEKDEKIN